MLDLDKLMPAIDTKTFGLRKAMESLDWMDRDRRTPLLRLMHKTLEPHITGPWQSYNNFLEIDRSVYLYVAVCGQFYVELQIGRAETKACIRQANSKEPSWFEASLDTDSHTDFVGWLSMARNALDEWVESRTKPAQFALPELWWAQTEKKRGWT